MHGPLAGEQIGTQVLCESVRGNGLCSQRLLSGTQCFQQVCSCHVASEASARWRFEISVSVISAARSFKIRC